MEMEGDKGLCASSDPVAQKAHRETRNGLKQAEGSMFARNGVLHPNAMSVLQEDMHTIIAGQSTYLRAVSRTEV